MNPLPKSKTEKKLENLLRANDEKVSVGHFAESGTHYSGFTFPELMMLHHNGTNHIPARPVLEILFNNQPRILNNPAVRKAVKQYTDSKMTKKDLTTMLQTIGQVIGEEEVDIFGSRLLAPNAKSTAAAKPDGNVPLVDTQDLVNETSYKDSVTKKRRKVI